MQITVSGKAKTVPDQLTVASLIEQEKVEMPQYVTVTINNAFVKRDEFPTRALSEGDVVEFLYYMGGGQAWA